MINICLIGGIIVSKKFNVTTTSKGKRKLNFVLANKRPYKEGGSYKDNLIICECWKPNTIDYILEHFESGARVTLEGEFKVDTRKDDKGYHNRAYLSISECYPLTYKNYNPEWEEQKDEDFAADVAQIDWGDSI